MTIIVWNGYMGCGMGVCSVAQLYWENRLWVLDHISEFSEKCQGCIRDNEKAGNYRSGPKL